jgi:hypothetical protein
MQKLKAADPYYRKHKESPSRKALDGKVIPFSRRNTIAASLKSKEGSGKKKQQKNTKKK